MGTGGGGKAALTGFDGVQEGLAGLGEQAGYAGVLAGLGASGIHGGEVGGIREVNRVHVWGLVTSTRVCQDSRDKKGLPGAWTY